MAPTILGGLACVPWKENMPSPLEQLLELYPDLEELFEVLDITPLEVLEALFNLGLIKIPEYLENE